MTETEKPILDDCKIINDDKLKEKNLDDDLDDKLKFFLELISNEKMLSINTQIQCSCPVIGPVCTTENPPVPIRGLWIGIIQVIVPVLFLFPVETFRQCEAWQDQVYFSRRLPHTKCY